MKLKFILFCVGLVLIGYAWLWQWNYYSRHYTALTRNMLLIVKGTYVSSCIEAGQHWRPQECGPTGKIVDKSIANRAIVEYCALQADTYTAEFAKLLEQIDQMVKEMERRSK